MLTSFNIMDYSLLIGVHYLSEESARTLKQRFQAEVRRRPHPSPFALVLTCQSQQSQDKNYRFTSVAEMLSIQQASANFGYGDGRATVRGVLTMA